MSEPWGLQCFSRAAEVPSSISDSEGDPVPRAPAQTLPNCVYTKMRTAIFYHYYEKKRVIPRKLGGIFSPLLIARTCISSLSLPDHVRPTLPNFKNVTYICTENRNNDYGGYALALAQLKDLNHFDYFIFCNSSCRGPFFSRLFNRSWTDIFLRQFEKDVELIGSSINIMHNDQTPCRRISKAFCLCSTLFPCANYGLRAH